MDYDLVVEGRAVTPGGVRDVQIGVNGTRIAAIKTQGLKGTKRIDAMGCLVFPGFIDVHAHLREPGWEYKEDFTTGTKAAANGGVTTVFDMPNNPVPATDVATIDEKLRLAKSKALVDVRLFGGVNGHRLEDIARIADRVIGYKIYLARTTGDLVLPHPLLGRALSRIADTRRPADVHCEDQSVIDSSVKKAYSSSNRADSHADLRPPEAEVRSIKRLLATRTEARINVCHISTGSGLRLVRRAQETRVGLACEATLHHLFFTRKDMLTNRLLRTNPPLRGEADRSALLDALGKGKVDFLVTDHAPHTLEEKLTESASGVPGLDFYGGIVAWLIMKCGLSPMTIAKVCSGNQARFFGLRDRGNIYLGTRADLTILDLRSTRRATSRDVFSKCGWTPYEGRDLPGRARWTISRGKPLVTDFEMS